MLHVINTHGGPKEGGGVNGDALRKCKSKSKHT
jgi:hypothetical protein